MPRIVKPKAKEANPAQMTDSSALRSQSFDLAKVLFDELNNDLGKVEGNLDTLADVYLCLDGESQADLLNRLSGLGRQIKTFVQTAEVYDYGLHRVSVPVADDEDDSDDEEVVVRRRRQPVAHS